MGDLATFAKLTFSQLAAVIALFLPGFVSLKVDRLIQPAEDLKAPELVIEAFAYSLVNAGFLSWPIILVFQQLGQGSPDFLVVWPLAILICVVGPTAWPIIFRMAQRLGASKGWLLGAHRFAWDDYFSRTEACWVIIHLTGGELVGGYFGTRSYATVQPEPGHIYIEELWELDSKGRFVRAIPSSNGALFRPSDYHWIEFLKDEQARTEQ